MECHANFFLIYQDKIRQDFPTFFDDYIWVLFYRIAHARLFVLFTTTTTTTTISEICARIHTHCTTHERIAVIENGCLRQQFDRKHGGCRSLKSRSAVHDVIFIYTTSTCTTPFDSAIVTFTIYSQQAVATEDHCTYRCE